MKYRKTNAINISLTGVKCDHCDWKLYEFPDGSKFGPMPLEFFKELCHNTACPKCGANLLTDADIFVLTNFEKFVGFVNTILRPYVWVKLLFGWKSDHYTVPSLMNGTGKLGFDWDKRVKQPN